MGNQAIALGAIRAGVKLVCGYPGTPSTEVLETVARNNPDKSIYVEWSVNEKAALEIAAGAAMSGARALVTMKQVGLNVASDPLMSLAYVGVEGGMVVLAADDPGPMSSQTEQDTRVFGLFSRLPVFDPSSPEEAYLMIADAFDFSEKYHTPVLFRPTTRICHGSSVISLLPPIDVPEPKGFVKDTKRWVIFPRSSYENHIRIEKRNPELGKEFGSYWGNTMEDFPAKDMSADTRYAIVAGGVSYAYVKEALSLLPKRPAVKLLKIATPHPFPEDLALEAISSCDKVLVAEELSPMLERELQIVAGKHHLPVEISGKQDGFMPTAGENNVDILLSVIRKWLSLPEPEKEAAPEAEVTLPARPCVLCAGCPHRGAFYSVKQAMKGKKAIFCGDIGCYTLGNAPPLDMVDTCLCMGADVTMAQGLARENPDATCFSFIGDSTFFASGITGTVNAIYNQTRIVLIILDNSTTAMTGHQPHPGTGRTMMEQTHAPVSMEKLLEGLGIPVTVADPLDLKASVAAVKAAAEQEGPAAIIFRSPCIALYKPECRYTLDEDKCIRCHICTEKLGCPAISLNGDGSIAVDEALCYGCGLCAQVCPKGALVKKGGER